MSGFLTNLVSSAGSSADGHLSAQPPARAEQAGAASPSPGTAAASLEEEEGLEGHSSSPCVVPLGSLGSVGSMAARD